jgi:hypothetical protein
MQLLNDGWISYMIYKLPNGIKLIMHYWSCIFHAKLPLSDLLITSEL